MKKETDMHNKTENGCADNNININEMFRVGVITEPHGIKGEVKVFPTTDDPSRMGRINEIYSIVDNKITILHPTSARTSKNLMIVAFKEITDRNKAELFRKNELYITRQNACRLNKDEYYIADLIGLKVYDDKETHIGTLTDVFETGANDVYEITEENGNTFLVPAVKECILDVNTAEEFIRIHILEGLR